MDRTRRRMRRGRYLRDVHNFLFLVNPLTPSAYSSNLLTKFPIIRLLSTPFGSHMSLSPCDPPHKKRARAAPMRRAESCTPRRACLERLLSSLPCSYRRLSTLLSPPHNTFSYTMECCWKFSKSLTMVADIGLLSNTVTECGNVTQALSFNRGVFWFNASE